MMNHDGDYNSFKHLGTQTVYSAFMHSFFRLVWPSLEGVGREGDRHSCRLGTLVISARIVGLGTLVLSDEGDGWS